MDIQQKKGQIVVIGNGFDRESTLKSSYSDFYGHRYDSAFLESYTKLKNNYILNDDLEDFIVWDVFYLFKKEGREQQWSDVESELKTVLTDLQSPSRNNLSFGKIAQCIKYFRDLHEEVWIDSQESVSLGIKNPRMQDICTLIKNCGIESGIIAKMVYLKANEQGFTDWHNPTRLKDLYSKILLEDLKTYEFHFRTYLNTEVTKNEHYEYRAIRTMGSILSDEVKIEESNNYLNSILSFNYTEPFSSKPEKLNLQKIKNVHGTLSKSNLIFGVDFHNIESLDFALQFTKTFRTMKLEDYDLNKNLFDADVCALKFYGHSLAEADYSYFVSLFDTVDLYHSNTKLIFYYKNSNPEESYNSECIKVSKLISNYGSTFTNRDHGKNLLHKLILEGRLSVKKLDKKTNSMNAF